MERRVRMEMSQLSMEDFTTSFYYFCKFRKGSDDFWK